MILIEALNIRKYFPLKNGQLVKAVDDVSFTVQAGETLGMVGESGCGKSTIGRVMLDLLKPTSGKLLFGGCNIFKLPRRERRDLCRKIGIVFQDPYSSLNPRMNVLEIVGEPLLDHHKIKGRALRDAVIELLAEVGLKPEHINRYPHHFSGGQRQRIGIARALALGPEFLILDEPTSALDVSIQAQVLNLLKRLQGAKNLTYLFITHDLNVVRHIADRVVVMYLGKLVEEGAAVDIFRQPLHPYTQALLSANPKIKQSPDRKHRPLKSNFSSENPKNTRIHGKKRLLLRGDVPSPANPPPGCRFHTRCPIAKPDCSKNEPLVRRIGNRNIVCHAV